MPAVRRLVIAAAVLTSGLVSTQRTVAAAAPPALAAGQQVKVEGRMTEGVFRAIQVTLRDSDGTVKVEGIIETAQADRRRLRVVGFDVTADASTRLYRGSQPSHSRAALRPGTWVEAKGSWRAGAIKASRIRLKDNPETTEEIEGVIQSADQQTGTLVILDRRVVLDGAVAILDERTGASADASRPDQLRRDDDERPGREPMAFGNVVVGGRLEGGFVDEENFAVGEGRSERAILSRTQLIASSRITDTVEGYGKLTLSRSAHFTGSAQGDARLSEAWLLFHEVGGFPVDLQVGRQRFRDTREWFFDEYLDAVRVHARLPHVKLEAAVSRGIASGELASRERRDQLQVLGSASTAFRGIRATLRGVSRRDATRGESPTWLGVSFEGSASQRWTYWSDTTVRRGSAGTKRLGGWATDAGVRQEWRRAGSPALTLAYAYASGTSGPAAATDTRFRQTDLEDNQAYFGGIRRVARYGELFDPELSNLHVFTAGFGLQPSRSLSVEGIYHEFRQATLTRSLPSSNLDASLTGVHARLGREADVVITVRAIRGLDIDLASGLFLPGPAFGEARNRPAFFVRPQLRLYF
jgi:hypothetical protein